MKKILLPTDFSKNAWNAFKYAHKLYENETVQFHFLHAFRIQNYTVDSMMVAEPGEAFYEKALQNAQFELQKIIARIEMFEISNHHTFFTKTVFGLPVEAALNYIEQKDIDILITCNKGETNAFDVLLGSNAVDFMEKVRNCPVLMIPAQTIFTEPNEIVFPTNFNTPFKRRELKHLYEISKITNAPIRVLHLLEGDELTKEQYEKKALLEECFDGLNYTFHFLENGDVQETLYSFTQSRKSGMISFINKKHSFLESLFSKPLVQELGHHATIPVLVLHDISN